MRRSEVAQFADIPLERVEAPPAPRRVALRDGRHGSVQWMIRASRETVLVVQPDDDGLDIWVLESNALSPSA